MEKNMVMGKPLASAGFQRPMTESAQFEMCDAKIRSTPIIYLFLSKLHSYEYFHSCMGILGRLYQLQTLTIQRFT